MSKGLFVVERLSPSGKTWTEVADAKSLGRGSDKYFAELRKNPTATFRLRLRQQKDANGRVVLRARTLRSNNPIALDPHHSASSHEGL